jgi:hypothetical protein
VLCVVLSPRKGDQVLRQVIAWVIIAVMHVKARRKRPNMGLVNGSVQ